MYVRYGPRFIITATFIAIAVVFGGGGSPAPLAELVVQITALIALCAWAMTARHDSRQLHIDSWLLAGAVALAAIPLLQLIPLPPALWHALSGRSNEVASLTLVGAAERWYPLSLSPYRTLASLLALLPPLTAVYFVSQLELADRTRLLFCVVVLVLASAIVGVLQIAGGESNAFRFYGGTNSFFETGFQANRNSTADILLIGIVALSALGVLKLHRQSSRVTLLLAAAATMFLMFSVVLTGSRTGTVLLLMCGVTALALFRPKVRLSRTLLISVTAVSLVGIVTVSMLWQNPAIERTWQRFAEHADLRSDIWQDARFAVATYWPIGSGMGTFMTVFPAAERLEVVDSFVVNRAHNDYLEFALEAGVGGCLFLAAALLAIGWRMIAILRGGLRRTVAVHAIAGLGMVAILALHSLVDYPMRSMSLAVLAGFAVALLSRYSARDGVPRGAPGTPFTETV